MAEETFREITISMVRKTCKVGQIVWTYAGREFYADDVIEILENVDGGEESDLGNAYMQQLMLAAVRLLTAAKTGNGDVGEGRLQSFLYLLMRDKLPTSDVVDCVKAVEGTDDNVFTAAGLAEYADELAGRILGDG